MVVVARIEPGAGAAGAMYGQSAAIVTPDDHGIPTATAMPWPGRDATILTRGEDNPRLALASAQQPSAQQPSAQPTSSIDGADVATTVRQAMDNLAAPSPRRRSAAFKHLASLAQAGQRKEVAAALEGAVAGLVRENRSNEAALLLRLLHQELPTTSRQLMLGDFTLVVSESPVARTRRELATQVAYDALMRPADGGGLDNAQVIDLFRSLGRVRTPNHGFTQSPASPLFASMHDSLFQRMTTRVRDISQSTFDPFTWRFDPPGPRNVGRELDHADMMHGPERDRWSPNPYRLPPQR